MRRQGGAIGIAVISVAVFTLSVASVLTPCSATSVKPSRLKIIYPEPEPDIRLGEPGDMPNGRVDTSALETAVSTEENTPENDDNSSRDRIIVKMICDWLLSSLISVR